MNISEVGKQAGLPAKTIRYYEEIGLVSPRRDTNGYRVFQDSDLHKLAFVARARALGFSIEDCRLLMVRRRQPRKLRRQEAGAGSSAPNRRKDCCVAGDARHLGGSGDGLPWRCAARLSDPQGSGPIQLVPPVDQDGYLSCRALTCSAVNIRGSIPRVISASFAVSSSSSIAKLAAQISLPATTGP